MRIELKRNSFIIIPETDQDRAFIEDTLKLRDNGSKTEIARINSVGMGFVKNDEYVLKVEHNAQA